MAFFFVLVFLPMAIGESPVYVRTKSGSIRGFQRVVLGKPVDHFLGVPFAQPPLGDRRFQVPEPAKPWTNVRNATTLSPTCWQYIPSAIERNNGGSGIWVNNTAMSEDCLYLNVWAPKITAGAPPKAIMVWIFGGGFMTGSANLLIYDGSVLAAEQDIIVVTVQYRVSIFGFLNLASTTANAGLFDQRLAFRWLFDNAKSFNGDNSRITLVGESAGAASVSMHLLSPASHRLFKRAVLHSATFLSPWAFVSPSLLRERSRRMAIGVGCLSSDASAANAVSDSTVLKCLQGVSASRLNAKVGTAISGEQAARVKALNAKLGYSATPAPNSLLYDFSFGPTQLAPFFPVNWTEAMERETLKPAGLLVGTNANEATYFLLYYLPVLANRFFGAKPKLPEWPKDVIQLGITPKRVTELIARYVLPNHLLSPSLVSLLGLWYDFPQPQVNMSAAQRAEKVLTAMDRTAGDYCFKCPLYDVAKWYARRGHPVYMYTFAHRSAKLPMPAWMGVMHGYELDYLFGMPKNALFTKTFYDYTPLERKLSEEMMRKWANFVKTGNPNEGSGTESVIWPMFNETSNKVLRLTSDASQVALKVTEEGADRLKDCRFWELTKAQLQSQEKYTTGFSTCQTNTCVVPQISWLLTCSTILMSLWIR